MIFPWTRHYHRYEYLIQRGWVDGKTVADVGCGMPAGANCMTSKAKMVHAIDPILKQWEGKAMLFFSAKGCNTNKRLRLVNNSLFDIKGYVYDVVTAVELFEHMPDPHVFIKHLSTCCKELFLTTPLATKTGRTRNPQHLAEYSAKDFDNIVGEGFIIKEKMYQHADLRITKNAKSNGDSFDDNHVVQMAWCKRRKRRA